MGSGHHMATSPVSPRSDELSGFLYEGRYARIARLLAVAVITGTAFIGQPRPSWSGDGLVILISLVVAVACQVIATTSPSGHSSRWVLTRIVVEAVSCGVLVGYDPAVGTAILLIFVGLDAGASLDLGPGGVVTGLAVVTTAIATLSSGQATDNVSLGSVVVIGFLAAAGRKQYMLRADQAELRLADAERAREEHARAAGLAERANGRERSTTSSPTVSVHWSFSSMRSIPCSPPAQRIANVWSSSWPVPAPSRSKGSAKPDKPSARSGRIHLPSLTR